VVDREEAIGVGTALVTGLGRDLTILDGRRHRSTEDLTRKPPQVHRSFAVGRTGRRGFSPGSRGVGAET
jgi:hypothetical protein